MGVTFIESLSQFAISFVEIANDAVAMGSGKYKKEELCNAYWWKLR